MNKHTVWLGAAALTPLTVIFTPLDLVACAVAAGLGASFRSVWR